MVQGAEIVVVQNVHMVMFFRNGRTLSIVNVFNIAETSRCLLLRILYKQKDYVIF